MAERQNHGFKYQDIIYERYPDIDHSGLGYTDEWDGMLHGIPVSIKSESVGSDVEMADFFRNANKKTGFFMFVGFHDSNYNYVEEYVLYIPINYWRSLFCQNLMPYFKRLLQNITNDYADDQRWKKGCNLLRNYWQKYTSNIIRPRFKRDHKDQKRMQCAINNGDFHKHFLKFGVELDAKGNQVIGA